MIDNWVKGWFGSMGGEGKYVCGGDFLGKRVQLLNVTAIGSMSTADRCVREL